MDLYAYQRAIHGDDATQKELAPKAGVNPCRISQWKADHPEFEAWLEERVEYYRADIHEVLAAVARKNLDDFRFWEAMALKYNFITKAPAAPKDADGEASKLQIVYSEGNG